jgi:uncharacterized protein (TIGR01777 family)
MNVLLAGATGFIGRRLERALRARGDDVTAVSLRDPEAAAAAAAQCDAIVNLAGEPLAQHWDETVKLRIESSRVEAPRRFLEALSRRTFAARAYVSASAIGYYGTSETATFDEASGPGDDFLARVCAGWEHEARQAAGLGMRVAIVRTGVALGADGGALAKLLPPFRMGAGGIVGNGRQWLSWVHVDDVVGVYLLALDGAEGPLNACAPNPVTNAQFTHALGRALHRPTLLPVPTFALRAMLGEGADMLLQGQKVLPLRTQELGYRFAFPDLSGALANLL